MLVGLLATGCYHLPELTQGGTSVVVSHAAPRDIGWDPAGCKWLGEIEGYAYDSGMVLDSKLVERMR